MRKRRYEWKQKIKNASIEAGTYHPCCENIIVILANTMVLYDDAVKRYQSVSDKDFANKNACSIRVETLTKVALPYWKELGLTSKEFYSISGLTNKEDVRSPIEKDIEKFYSGNDK